MTYIPYSPEVGAIYTLTGPDGTIAVFNDPTDPNYVGMLTDVTGLDSPNVRESGDDSVEADGGWHGNFWYGRRPITLAGTVFGASGPDARTARLDRLRRASNALRGDAVLKWTNSGLSSVPMYTPVRRQQPLRITGAWVKTFQLQLVSAEAPLLSYQLHSANGANLMPNGALENDASGYPTIPTDYTVTGGTATHITAQHHTGNRSVQLTATGGSVLSYFKGATTSPWLPAGVTSDDFIPTTGPIVFSFWTKGATTGRQWHCYVWWYDAAGTFISATTGADGPPNTGAWTQSTLTATPPAGAAMYSFRAVSGTSPAAGEIHYIDDFSVSIGGIGGAVPVVIENKGDTPYQPTLYIYGPLASAGDVVVITNTTTGSQIKFQSFFNVAGNEHAVLFTDSHTLYRYNNQGVSLANNSGALDFVNSTWAPAIPGFNSYELNIVPAGLIGAVSYPAGLRADWRDAWS